MKTYTLTHNHQLETSHKKATTGKKKKTSQLLLLAIITVTGILLGVNLLLISEAESNELVTYHEIQVKSGDTLWELASQYLKPNEDIRKFIYDIRQVNNLESAEIFPGQIIRIPTS